MAYQYEKAKNGKRTGFMAPHKNLGSHRLVDLNNAAKFLGVPVQKVKEWTAAGDLPTYNNTGFHHFEDVYIFKQSDRFKELVA